MKEAVPAAKKTRIDIGTGIAKLYLALVLLFLYVPIFVMAAMAFNPLHQGHPEPRHAVRDHAHLAHQGL